MSRALSPKQKQSALAALQAECDQLLERAYAMGRDDCGYGADAHEESYKLFSNRQLRQAYVEGWNKELT